MNNHKLLSVILLGACLAAPIVGFSQSYGASTPNAASNGATNGAQSAMQKTGQYFDDATVTTKVKAALMGDAGLKAFDINVVTYNGRVQLSGFVDTQKTADMAGDKAKTVEGVKTVINSLQIK